MANIVTDTFDRANNALTMGSADTGQIWVPQLGSVWGISSNLAYTSTSGVIVGAGVSSGITVVDALVHNVIAQVTATAINNGASLVGWYVDDSNYLSFHYRGDFNIWTYYEITGGFQTDIHFFNFGSPPPAPGDVLRMELCDVPVPQIALYQNGLELFAANITHPTPFVGATKYGLGTNNTNVGFNDFTVDENLACVGAQAAWSLPPIRWRATGSVAAPPASATLRFNAGQGTDWYLVGQISDSGEEMRDKTVKSVTGVGKTTAAYIKLYGWQPTEEMVIEDLEQGINSATGAIAVEDTNNVARTERFQVNVAHVLLHTVRVEGTWDGVGIPDRIDEITYELAVHGARR